MNAITPTLIYWITRLELVNRALGCTAGFSGLCFVAGLWYYLMSTTEGWEDDAKRAVRLATREFVALAVSTVLYILTPTTREMAAILVIPKIANSETVAEIGDGVKTLAVEWLEELRPNKKGETKKGGAE